MSKTYTKAEIFEAITKDICTVSFTKVNGDIRHMDCSLNIDHMSKEAILKLLESSDKPKKATNDKVLAVWDVKAVGWRSFRIDSVFEVKKSLDL